MQNAIIGSRYTSAESSFGRTEWLLSSKTKGAVSGRQTARSLLKSLKQTTPPDLPNDADGTRRLILHHAAVAFAERGFAAASMQDLANRVGITKAGLYYHFQDKNAIYEAIVIDTLNDLIDNLSHEHEQDHSAEDRLRTFCRLHAQFFTKNTARYVATAVGFDALVEPAHSRAITMRDTYERRFRQVVTQGIKSGEFSQVDPVITTRLILSVLNYLARWWRPDGSTSAEEIVEKYLDVLLGGLRA